MKYEQLHRQAKHIDRLIDVNLHAQGMPFLPQEDIKTLVTMTYPEFFAVATGWHKVVFGNKKIDQSVVLKVGPKKSIEGDHRAYKRIPHKLRHQLFARIFWHTRYCLLQEYGYPTQVTPTQLAHLRRLVYPYGIFDVKDENLRTVNGKLKIIDANVTRIPLPTVLRKIDEIKPKIPQKLDSAIKKITKRLYERQR